MTFRVSTFAAACCLLTSALLPAAAASQAAPEQDQLRVFIDCAYFCDMDLLRTEVNWVDYMRDRTDADVHVLVSRQPTGGGGSRFTVEFIGLRDLSGMQDTLVFTTSVNDTDDVRRRQLVRTIALGLVRYAANTPVASRLTIGLAGRPAANAAAAAVADAAPARDPWNFWTFTLSANGGMDGEKSRGSYRISNSVSANRTTEDWKINLRMGGNYNEQSYTFFNPATSSDTTVTSINRNYSLNGLLVKSLGPNLSAGFTSTVSTSTYGNTELSVTLQPAVEYNVFPYSESTRRQLTARYGAGLRMYDYRDTTVYLQTEETRPIHTLAIGYSTRQPWGSVNVGVDGSQYLHDTSLYSADIGGGVSDIRLFKGFSFNLFGNYSLIRDQITLQKGRLTPAEVLLRQRELETGYRYRMSMGISYRFGSIFNNVVNPRFGGGGGGMIIMM